MPPDAHTHDMTSFWMPLGASSDEREDPAA